MNDINLLPEELRGAEEKELARAKEQTIPASFYVPPKEPAAPRPVPAAPVLAVKASEPKIIPASGFKADHQLIPPKLMTDQETGLNVPKRETLLARFFKKQRQGTILKNTVAKNHNNRFIERSLDVNLIPEGSDLLPVKKLYNRFMLFGLAGCLVLAIIYFGLVFYTQKIASDDQNLAAALAAGEIKYNQLKQQEKDLTSWLERMGLIKNLFAEHVYWTNFFKALEAVTIPTVYYQDIATAWPGEVVLNATADSYLSVAKQYLAYQEATNVIKSAAISGLKANETEGISFTVNLSFSPNVYQAAPK